MPIDPPKRAIVHDLGLFLWEKRDPVKKKRVDELDRDLYLAMREDWDEDGLGGEASSLDWSNGPFLSAQENQRPFAKYGQTTSDIEILNRVK